MPKDLTRALEKSCYVCSKKLDPDSAWEYIKPHNGDLRDGPYTHRLCRINYVWRRDYIDPYGAYSIKYPDSRKADEFLNEEQWRTYQYGLVYSGITWRFTLKGADHLTSNQKEVHGTCYVCALPYKAIHDSWADTNGALVHNKCHYCYVRVPENWFSGTVRLDRPMTEDDWRHYTGLPHTWEKDARSEDESWWTEFCWSNRGGMKQEDWERYTGASLPWLAPDFCIVFENLEAWTEMMWEQQGGMQPEDWARYLGLT